MRADARVHVQSRILNGPLARPYLRFRPRLRPLDVGRHSDLVIEGFPRSGSSFARANVITANPGVTVSSHLHSVRSVVRASRRGVPCVVLLRHPRDSVASYLQFQPGVSAGTAFRMYRRFYDGVEPHLDDCLVVTFDRLVTDFDAVVEGINARFGSTLRAPGAGDSEDRPGDERRSTDDVEAHLKEAASLVAARLGRHPDELVGSPRESRRSTAEMLAHLRPTEVRAQAAAQNVWERVRNRADALS